jgi:hypothetical protein
LPTLQDFLNRNLSFNASPQERASLISAYAGILGGGQTQNREMIALMGGGGIPGSLGVNAMNADTARIGANNVGRAADIQHGPQARLDAMFVNQMAANRAAGGTDQQFIRDWQGRGWQMPSFLGGSPISGSAFPTSAGGPAAAQTVPGQTPTGGQTAPNQGVTVSDLWTQIMRQHGTPVRNNQGVAVSYDPPRDTPGVNRALTDLILRAQSQGALNGGDNIADLMEMVYGNFQEPAFRSFAQQPFHTIGTTTDHERALMALQQAVNRQIPNAAQWERPGPLSFLRSRLSALPPDLIQRLRTAAAAERTQRPPS